MRRVRWVPLVVLLLGCGKDDAPAHPQDAGEPDVQSDVVDGVDASLPAAVDLLDPDIGAMRDSIRGTPIASSITKLVDFGTRSACTPDGGDPTKGIDAARDWIRAELEAIPGLTGVKLDPYAQTKCKTPFTRNNVVAWITGAHPERLIVIGGHYDSRTVDVTDGTSAAPGANDSGSQTSLVLAAARAMAGHEFDATVVFVAFAGEEQGLVGSAAFASGITTLFPAGKVEAMLNCDIVGGDNTVNDAESLKHFRLYSPGTPREVGTSPDGSSDDTSPSRGLMRFVGKWGSAYVPAMSMMQKLREDRVGRGGDHISFIANGYAAVRFIEPVESLAHQHTGDDLFAYVTPEYTASMTKVVVSVASVLARAPIAPKDFTANGSATADLTMTWSASPGIDHFVLVARTIDEDLHSVRLRVPSTSNTLTLPSSVLGFEPGKAFYLSIAAVDAAGHESIYAYPEVRCDEAGCAVPEGATDVTLTSE